MRETLLEVTRGLVVRLWSDGGQRGSRRNAWAAMVDDSVRARERADAERALLRLTREVGSVARG